MDRCSFASTVSPIIGTHGEIRYRSGRNRSKSSRLISEATTKALNPTASKRILSTKLMSDVNAVIDHLGHKSATLVGHDWGGFVAWSFAMQYPERTDRLVVLNLPHPWGLQRELATNPEQAANSQYARNFQLPLAHQLLSAESLAAWVKAPSDREKYVIAFRRSSFAGMLNYYKANYPRPPYQVPDQAPPQVKAPVLVLHGLGDQYLLASGLNDTWRWVQKDLTLVTIPDAKHFVQHDKPKLVTDTVYQWLLR